MELSHLIYIFLNTEESNKVDADVIGKRRLENVLVVPATRTLLAKYKNIFDVLTKGSNE